MNKEELIKHFQEQKRIAEEEITFWQAQPDAEAEKPKLRHGDFGIKDEGNCRSRIFLSNFVEGFDWHKPTGDHQEYSEIGIMGDEDFTIFGNVFDLMKGWSEDSDRANIDGFVIEICGDRIVIGGRRFLIKQATEFWHKLGQLIATYKRKENKCN